LIAAGVAAAAASAAWAVVASSATRLPGEEITGRALAPQAIADSLQRAQQAADRGDDLTAVKDYQKILNSDPNQAEALAGEGWLLAQTQQPALLQQGLTMLLDSERSDPSYAPAHVYRGISLLSEGDYSDAIPELQWYLAHSPDPQLAPRVRAALSQAEAQLAAAAKTPKG
jgi:Tfp pilus assembly protein PilF